MKPAFIKNIHRLHLDLLNRTFCIGLTRVPKVMRLIIDNLLETVYDRMKNQILIY